MRLRTMLAIVLVLAVAMAAGIPWVRAMQVGRSHILLDVSAAPVAPYSAARELLSDDLLDDAFKDPGARLQDFGLYPGDEKSRGRIRVRLTVIDDGPGNFLTVAYEADTVEESRRVLEALASAFQKRHPGVQIAVGPIIVRRLPTPSEWMAVAGALSVVLFVITGLIWIDHRRSGPPPPIVINHVPFPEFPGVGDMPTELTVTEALLRRRATRHFDPSRPIDEVLLLHILTLATQAPSGFNLQPWRFVVVRSQSRREKLQACAFGQSKVAEAPVVVIVLGHHHPHRTHLDQMADSQVKRGVLTPDEAAALKGRALATMERQPDLELWATRSAMLAAMCLMLAAESHGVRSAPMEGFDEEKVRAAFGVPDDHAVCCLICLGHARETKPFPGRFNLEDVCYREHFGQPWDLDEETT